MKQHPSSRKYSEQKGFPFPTKRQRRNLAKYSDGELMEYEKQITDYWTIVEAEMLLRSQGNYYKGKPS